MLQPSLRSLLLLHSWSSCPAELLKKKKKCPVLNSFLLFLLLLLLPQDEVERPPQVLQLHPKWRGNKYIIKLYIKKRLCFREIPYIPSACSLQVSFLFLLCLVPLQIFFLCCVQFWWCFLRVLSSSGVHCCNLLILASLFTVIIVIICLVFLSYENIPGHMLTRLCELNMRFIIVS